MSIKEKTVTFLFNNSCYWLTKDFGPKFDWTQRKTVAGKGRRIRSSRLPLITYWVCGQLGFHEILPQKNKNDNGGHTKGKRWHWTRLCLCLNKHQVSSFRRNDVSKLVMAVSYFILKIAILAKKNTTIKVTFIHNLDCSTSELFRTQTTFSWAVYFSSP